MAEDDPTSQITDDHSTGVGGLGAQLDQLKASATQQYSLKNYSAAAELFSRGVELQDEINGEMSPDNAHLLYQYGRCLYHVAVQASDVLGGKVAESKPKPKKKKRKVEDAGEGNSKSGGLIGDAIANGEQKLAENAAEKETTKKEAEVSSNPYFQITGDENWTDSEDSGDEGGEDGDAEEEEDDFQTAYEILDMARVLLARKIESLSSNSKASTPSPELRLLRERLADTHDLQAEISLENERFTDAISDTKESLALKLELYPQESSLVAEAHYKLSLALEFASVTSTTEGANGEASVAEVNEEMRGEAAVEMEKAIASCRARITQEENTAATLDADKKKALEASIADVKEMVGDMEQRLTDLRKPAASLSALQTGEDGDVLQGVLGAMLGAGSKGEAEKKLKEATAQANDLTGLVKKKKVKAEPVVEGKGKRKADDIDAEAGNDNGKRAKVEEVKEEA